MRIGELVRELDKATTLGRTGEIRSPSSGTSKREAIREAGLSKSTANRYEGLAGPQDEDLQAAGRAAANEGFCFFLSKKNCFTYAADRALSASATAHIAEKSSALCRSASATKCAAASSATATAPARSPAKRSAFARALKAAHSAAHRFCGARPRAQAAT